MTDLHGQRRKRLLSSPEVGYYMLIFYIGASLRGSRRISKTGLLNDALTGETR